MAEDKQEPQQPGGIWQRGSSEGGLEHPGQGGGGGRGAGGRGAPLKRRARCIADRRAGALMQWRHDYVLGLKTVPPCPVENGLSGAPVTQGRPGRGEGGWAGWGALGMGRN